MANAVPKDRLQPALLDRLRDELGPTLGALAEARRRLEGLLDDKGRAALASLLADERLVARPPGEVEFAPFAGLDREGRELLMRVVELERIRQAELRRNFVISARQLQAAVLRDLQDLFNATHAEHEQGMNGEGVTGGALEGFPAAADSAINYGIPPIAGRVRTPLGFAEFARDIERAIRRFEPRIRNVRVSVGDEAAAAVAGNEPSSPSKLRSLAAYVVEGELWGYPFPESVRVRTVLDVDALRLEIAERVGGAEAKP